MAASAKGIGSGYGVREGPKRTWEYERPAMYPKQEAAMFDKRRIAVIEATTKSGKSVSAMVWITEQAMSGQPGWNYWWVAPVMAQARIIFNRLKRSLPPNMIETNKTEMWIHIIPSDTYIWFKSGDDPDNLYGEDVYAAVLDEASRMREESWHAVRTTLTATRGPIRIIGNVRGKKNWAYKLARRAEKGDKRYLGYHKITAYDAVDGGVLAKEEIEEARELLPADVFAELYLADAADDAGNPFGVAAIARCAALPEFRQVEDYSWVLVDREGNVGGKGGDVVAWGWDLARSRDWTVGIGLNRLGDVVRYLRFQKPWPETISIIRSEVGTVTPAFLDQTGTGDSVVGVIQRPVVGGVVKLDQGTRKADVQRLQRIRSALDAKSIHSALSGLKKEGFGDRDDEDNLMAGLLNMSDDELTGNGADDLMAGVGFQDEPDGLTGNGRNGVNGTNGRNGTNGHAAAEDAEYDPDAWDSDDAQMQTTVVREFAGDENIEGYVFTSRSKQWLMEGLAVALQTSVTRFPGHLGGKDHPIKIELDSFEYVYTRIGVKYSAPDGEHDDCVCSYGLAIQCLQQRAITLPDGMSLSAAGDLSRPSPWALSSVR